WSIQSTLPPQSTIVPIICASDKTHLTNFSGDKYLWLLYMTIGNIDKELRREKSSLAWIYIGLLPVSIDASSSELNAKQVWHTAVYHILAPLRCMGPLNLPCSDQQIRRCYLILNGWVADFPEQCTVAFIQNSWCPICTVSKDNMEQASPLRLCMDGL
ncbi:hypothetical protein BDZ91DRAFT_828749, partial [Kalaharituber pfeilii]